MEEWIKLVVILVFCWSFSDIQFYVRTQLLGRGKSK